MSGLQKDLAGLAAIAWNAVLSRLRVAKITQLDSIGLDDPSRKAACFVTWTLDGDLRGCIGTFEPGPIAQTVHKYAQIAAFEDPRFDPIEVAEVPSLEVAVTVLGDMEPCGVLEWTLGQHGVRAQYDGGLSATFLPEVAEEQGWTQRETLRQLAYKAGALSSAQPRKFWRYAGHKFTMSYEEYKEGLTEEV